MRTLWYWLVDKKLVTLRTGTWTWFVAYHVEMRRTFGSFCYVPEELRLAMAARTGR